MGAFDEAVKGDPGPSLGASFARSLGDHSVRLAAANYRAKTLERENAALRGALARSASIAASPAAARLSLADIREICLDALSRSALDAAGRRGSTDIAPASIDELDILRDQIIAEKDEQIAEAKKQLAAADAIIASDTKQIAELYEMAERRIGDLLASNNALLARAREAEAALRPLARYGGSVPQWIQDKTCLTASVTAGDLRRAAAVLAKIEGGAS